MQAEHLISGVHKATSEFREIVQTVIPAVARVQPLLNGTPASLEAAAVNVEGQLRAYVENILNQTLSKFTAPTLAMISDLAGAALEAQLQQIADQIRDAIIANPVVSIVDGLSGNLSALRALESTPAIAAQIASLEAQIAGLTAANPIISTVSQLRAQIADMTQSISTFSTFLSAQKNLVAGVTRSLKIGS